METDTKETERDDERNKELKRKWRLNNKIDLFNCQLRRIKDMVSVWFCRFPHPLQYKCRHIGGRKS